MPQARPDRLPTSSERHRDLVEALERLFMQEGFRSVTVDDLAGRLKCSKRTLYEIAPSKQELFLLVVQRWLDRIRHLGWAGALEHDDPERRLVAYLEPGVAESRTASGVFLEDLQSYRPAMALLENHQRERTNVLRDIIEDGIRRGRFRAVHSALVAEMFLAAVGRINEPEVLDRAGIGFSDAFSEFYVLLLNGIVAPTADS
ncbi:TetR/AcrR family transcriptional regulator [Phenylobacterium sp.]|uniref:TetR/AcrR family transcriptional regulator n=1 Tax=Phenylobacterium sp. TaxID=1871053 RepID=UPI00301E312F